jgi:ubiquinone biosynthesis accessory factor UbiK
MNKNPFGELPKPLADFQSKVGELVRSAPTADIERHLKGALNAALGKMDVVTREDFEIQAQMLARALEKLALLEKRLAALEHPAQQSEQRPK